MPASFNVRGCTSCKVWSASRAEPVLGSVVALHQVGGAWLVATGTGDDGLRLVHGVAPVAAVKTGAHLGQRLSGAVIVGTRPGDAALVFVVEVGLRLQAERVTVVALLACARSVRTWPRNYLNELVVQVVNSRTHRNARTLLNLHTKIH